MLPQGIVRTVFIIVIVLVIIGMIITLIPGTFL